MSKARLDELVEEALVDAYGESEQAAGFYTMRSKRPCSTCGGAGALARAGLAMWQGWALARGQKHHQSGVVVVILGEQSWVISRERRSFA